MWRLILVSALAGLLVGCDAPVGSFPDNDVYSLTLTRSRSVSADSAKLDAAAVTESLFGTPDSPKVPPELTNLVTLDRLIRAAGPVSSEKDGTHKGLYREHCVTCHGVDGAGAGPASLYQKPHPRNFCFGVFKWKSTQRSAKPTREDLMALLERGAPGSAMPSFAAIDSVNSPADVSDSSDLEALVDYVIYLSIRGEFERRLMAAAIDRLGYGEDQVDTGARLVADGDSEGADIVRDTLTRIVGEWETASDQVVPVPTATQLSESVAISKSIERGKAIFHGKIANCVGCHGPAGNGDAVMLDYDDWGKEYSTRIGLTPSNRDDMRPFRKAGALPPRPAEPRNLTLGVYRGGGDRETLYRRITQGIAGTPMPGVEVVPMEDGRGLTSDQVWDLVRYLQSLDPDRTAS